MKRLLLCGVLASACGSRANTLLLLDTDSGVAPLDGGADPGDRASPVDAGTKPTDGAVLADGTANDTGAPVDAGVIDAGPPVPCRSDLMCSTTNQVCDTVGGVCVDCVHTADCLGDGQSCIDHRCVSGTDAGPPPIDVGPPVDLGPPVDTGFPIDTGPPVDVPVILAAGAGATLVTGLGGASGFGANCVGPADDSAFSTVMGDAGTLPFAISFGAGFVGGVTLGAQNFPSFFLNTNGNLSFGSPFTTYTSQAFPASSVTVPIMAPFWADVDTRGATGTDGSVCFAVEPSRVVATWFRVGYFAMHTERVNSFQVILTPAASARGDVDVEFRYSLCQWTTGDASGGTGGLGGTPAQAGFDFDATHFLSLPGSLTASVLNLCATSNVGIPGVWRFQVRGGTPRNAM